MLNGRVASFLKYRFIEILGLFFIALGIFLGVAFFSYNPQDPSFNYATNAPSANWAGVAGAYVAEPVIEFIGLGAFVLVLIPIAWGIRLAFRKEVLKTWFRITMLVFCLPAVAGLFALVDNIISVPETWPARSFGGYIGYFAYKQLIGVLTPVGYTFTLFVIASFSLFFAMGVALSMWLTLVVFASRGLAAFVGFLFWPVRYYLLGRKDMEEEAEKLGVSITPKKKQKIEKVQKKIIEINKKSSEKENKRRQSQIAMDLKGKDEFQLPSVALLKLPAAKDRKENVNEASLQNNAQLLEKVLEDFGIKGKITRVRPGPVVTLYELEPAPGIKSSRIIALADDIARSMSAVSTRIAVIAGQNAIGIELPNEIRQTVLLRELIEMDEYRDNKHSLPLVLGKDIGGDSVIADLAKMPHLLVAGTTGSGKSVAINTMILSLLYKYTPAECRFIMIDPKMLELSMYEGIPHLLSPVVTEPGKAVVALKWTVREMENRYRLMSTLGVRNVASYNQRIAEAKKNREKLTRTVQTGFDPDTGKPIMEQVPLDITPLPFIVVVVDEMADLMLTAGKDIESSIQRLAQMARAAGIHIIMATQRPSVDVITGVIKANFPTRISFQVSSRIDSRTILGDQGAEQLLGMGDMLYMMGGGRIVRVHGPFVDEKEVEKVVAFLKKQGSPQYVEDVTKEEEELLLPGFEGGESDDLYQRAVSIVRQEGKASTSFIQRMLKIGYNRAADIMDRMEKEGIVSTANHVGKREVLL